MELKYLVTGCGRSGTGYMNKLFNDNGIKCGHEKLISPYPPIYGYEAESSWLATAHLKSIPSSVKIIRMKRQPEKIIKSWLDINIFRPSNKNNEFIRYIQKYINGIDVIKNSPLENAKTYYLEWTKLFDMNIGSRYYETIELDELMNHETFIIHGKEFTVSKEIINTKQHQKVFNIDISKIKL